MSAKQAKQTAAQFLRESAKIMGKYGEEPKLSGQRYQKVLAETQKTFQTLSAKQNK
jgi:hypothetical protein